MRRVTAKSAVRALDRAQEEVPEEDALKHMEAALYAEKIQKEIEKKQRQDEQLRRKEEVLRAIEAKEEN